MSRRKFPATAITWGTLIVCTIATALVHADDRPSSQLSHIRDIRVNDVRGVVWPAGVDSVSARMRRGGTRWVID